MIHYVAIYSQLFPYYIIYWDLSFEASLPPLVSGSLLVIRQVGCEYGSPKKIHLPYHWPPTFGLRDWSFRRRIHSGAWQNGPGLSAQRRKKFTINLIRYVLMRRRSRSWLNIAAFLKSLQFKICRFEGVYYERKQVEESMSPLFQLLAPCL